MYLHDQLVHKTIIEGCTGSRNHCTGFPDAPHRNLEKIALSEWNIHPLIITLDFWFLFLIRCHVLAQYFPIQRIQFQFLQPDDILNGSFCPIILISVPENKRIDLLFQFLKCKLVIIPHPEILLDRIVFAERDIKRMVTAIKQALCDQTGITLIRFNSPSLLDKHGCRQKYDTFDPGACMLEIKL